MDARQRLLDALAEVERLGQESVRGIHGPAPWHVSDRRRTARGVSIASNNGIAVAVAPQFGVEGFAEIDAPLIVALHSLLPTLSALREVVEMHELGTGGLCRACSYIDDEDCVEGEEYPCSTIRTLTRQFEEEPKA